MFYDRLKSLCDERGVNITNVVQELHMGSGNLSNWKSGRTPRGSTLSKLANYFKVSTDYLLGISDDPEKKPAPGDGGGQAGPPGYDSLNPANKAIVDRLIADLAENQSSP